MDKKKVWMIIAIYIATFMTAIEGTIVVTAAHAIVDDIGGAYSIALLFSTYLFATAIATPIMSRFADRYGKKRITMLGLMIFLIGTVMCGFSMHYNFLLVSRVIQGIGAGAVMPMTFALIGELFDFETRGKVMGLNNTAWGIASLIAPILGGVFVATLSWHWVFFVNIPFGIFVLWIIHYFYEEKVSPQPRAFGRFTDEIKQQLQMIACLFLLILSIQLLENHLIYGSILLLCSLGLSFVFYRFQLNKAHPVIPVIEIQNKKFSLFVLLTFLINGSMMGFQVYMPLWVQVELGLSATMGGLVLLPASIMFITGSYFSGALAEKYGQLRLLLYCLMLGILAFLLLSFLPQGTSYTLLLFISALTGFSIGTSLTSSVVTAQASANHNNLGEISGFITLFRNLGQSFLVTIFGIIYIYASKQDANPLDGYHFVYHFATLLFIGLLGVVYTFYRKEKTEKYGRKRYAK